MTESRVPPLQTMKQVAEFAGLSYETVRRAAVEYERSEGRSGLRTWRRTPRAARRVQVVDRDRWLAGTKPARSKRAARAA